MSDDEDVLKEEELSEDSAIPEIFDEEDDLDLPVDVLGLEEEEDESFDDEDEDEEEDVYDDVEEEDGY